MTENIMKQKQIIAIVSLVILLGIFIFFAWNRNNSVINQKVDKLTKDQKSFADEFTRTMQAEKNKK
jgi:F0F1-type ATP synthase membrane subunit b/b'